MKRSDMLVHIALKLADKYTPEEVYEKSVSLLSMLEDLGMLPPIIGVYTHGKGCQPLPEWDKEL